MVAYGKCKCGLSPYTLSQKRNVTKRTAIPSDQLATLEQLSSQKLQPHFSFYVISCDSRQPGHAWKEQNKKCSRTEEYSGQSRGRWFNPTYRRFETQTISFIPHLPVSFGRDTKSRWSLLSGVYARGSKISHTGGKCVTCSGLANSRKGQLLRQPQVW